MNEKDLNKMYLSAVRSRKKSGARWQKVGEVAASKVSLDSNENNFERQEKLTEFPRNFNVPTAMRNDEIAVEVKGRVQTLLQLAKQILTERQYAVFIMVAVKEPALTEREVAKVLSISPGRVHQLSAAAMTKLRRAYDERT